MTFRDLVIIQHDKIYSIKGCSQLKKKMYFFFYKGYTFLQCPHSRAKCRPCVWYQKCGSQRRVRLVHSLLWCVLWTGGCAWVLQLQAKEREIIVNPIQCRMHPLDTTGGKKTCVCVWERESFPLHLDPLACSVTTPNSRATPEFDGHYTFPPPAWRSFMWPKQNKNQQQQNTGYCCNTGTEIWKWRQISRFSVGLGLGLHMHQVS